MDGRSEQQDNESVSGTIKMPTVYNHASTHLVTDNASNFKLLLAASGRGFLVLVAGHARFEGVGECDMECDN